MTPKEKAEELVEKFSDLEDGEMYIGKAKQCALIAVAEIINSLENYGKASDELQNMENDFRYWQEVKQELLKIK